MRSLKEIRSELGFADVNQLGADLSAGKGSGMNLISADFDIIVVDRANEEMHGKPMIELIGKKCYREFSKREDICPDCPGRLALKSGQPHHAELQGVRDDSTRYVISCTAYPVMGPAGEPIAFIEVEEDITDRRRFEQLEDVLAGLRAALLRTYEDRAALCRGLDAAMALEGVYCGSVYVGDRATTSPTLVCQRGTPTGWLGSLPVDIPDSGEIELRLPTGSALGNPKNAEDHLTVALVVPIIARGETVAKLVLGLSGKGEVPSSTKVGLDSIRQEVGDFLARTAFERSQRRTAYEIDCFMNALPVAVWRVDDRGRITMWNRAAERLLGWKEEEVVGRRIPLSLTNGEETPKEIVCPNRLLVGAETYRLTCLCKNGNCVPCTIRGMPFGGALSDRSRVVFIAWAESCATAGGAEKCEPRDDLTSAEDSLPAAGLGGRRRVETPRSAVRNCDEERESLIIIADHDPVSRGDLVGILQELGYQCVECASADEAVTQFEAARLAGLVVELVVTELIMPSGSDGIAAAKAIRKHDPMARLIVSSEWPVAGHLEHGFAGAIKKPYRREEIEIVLRAGLAPR